MSKETNRPTGAHERTMRLRTEKAFKTYVIKEIYNGAVFERRVQIALADELDAERAGTPPDSSTAVNDEQLVSMIKSSEWIHKDLTMRAAAGNGILNEEQLKALHAGGPLGLTDAGKRTYTPPRVGTLEEPALLESSVAGVENEELTPEETAPVKVVNLEGEYTSKELGFLQKNFNKLKELFR